MRHLLIASVLLLGSARAETDRLRVVLEAAPQPLALQQRLELHAWVYSTADATETVHLELETQPLVHFAAALIVADGSLGGRVDCFPSLWRIVCDAPIRQMSPVQIIAHIDAVPDAVLAGLCRPEIVGRVSAALPGRQDTASLPIAIDAPARFCAYLPGVYGG